MNVKIDTIIAELKKIPRNSQPKQIEEEFIKIVKYLSFVATAATMPVPQKMVKETAKRVEMAGSIENIKRFLF